MGVPNCQLTTNFSANCQLTTIFLANCQLKSEFSLLQNVNQFWGLDLTKIKIYNMNSQNLH